MCGVLVPRSEQLTRRAHTDVAAVTNCAQCFCGKTYADANKQCNRSCPSATNKECSTGESCWAGCTHCTLPPAPGSGGKSCKINAECGIPAANCNQLRVSAVCARYVLACGVQQRRPITAWHWDGWAQHL